MLTGKYTCREQSGLSQATYEVVQWYSDKVSVVKIVFNRAKVSSRVLLYLQEDFVLSLYNIIFVFPSNCCQFQN